MSTPKPGGLPKPGTFLIRDMSGGSNLSTGRESIKDNEAWYMEGLQPIAPGNLKVIAQASVTGMSALVETTDPSYAMSFQIAGVPFIFVVFSSTGNGYIINASSLVSVQIFAGTLTSGTTCAAQWNKLGILIVDPTGYWDYGVTTAATLTALNRSVQSVTIFEPGSGYTAVPTVAFAGGGGAGAAATAYLGIGRAVINAGGAGYKVGDILYVQSAGANMYATLSVDTVSGAGAVTAVTITDPGEYIAPLPAAVAAATIGGAGNGATVDTTLNVSTIIVSARGSGYTSPPSATLVGGGPPTRAGSLVAVVSGSLGGTAIAAYAGRAWIASGRTVTFTDAGQYASFVGSGSQFTIDDSYLTNNITALFAANSYLYIFGNTSIDVLSNVTVTSAGTASFSRVNVNPVIGCDSPKTIFGYYRSVAFANTYGFYLLTGATVDNISEGKLDLLMSGITAGITSGFPVTMNGQLCAAWSINCLDPTTSFATVTNLIAIFNKGRWFFARQAIFAAPSTFLATRCTVTVPFTNFGFLAFAFDRTVSGPNTKLYQLFAQFSSIAWRLYTKLYDMGSPMTSKQATRVAIGCNLAFSTAVGALTLSVDSDQGNGTAATLPSVGAATGYQMFIATATGVPSNAKYVGWRASMQSTTTRIDRIDWLAMEAVESNQWQ